MNSISWLWGPRFQDHLALAINEIKLHGQSLNHIAVDGGAHVKAQLDSACMKSWLAIGDGDSIAAEFLDIIFPSDKNQSDLALALEKLPPNCGKLRAFGFTGGRLDHHMIAQGCFHRFLKQNNETQIRLDKNWLLLSAGRWKGHLNATTTSILTLNETTISLSGGWKWPLKQKKVGVLDDLLLSNEVDGDILELESNQPVTIYAECGVEQWWEQIND